VSLIAGAIHPVTAQTLPDTPPASWNAQERDAVAVVKEWIAGWNAHDAQRIAALMSEDCVFRPDPRDPWAQGRDKFLDHVLKSGLMRFSAGLKLTEVLPVGGPGDTFVLTKRIDYLTRSMNGQNSIPVAAFFRVKNGKIEEWLDEPIVAIGPGARRAPASAPQASSAPPR